MYYQIILGVLAAFLMIAYIDTDSLKAHFSDSKILKEYSSSPKLIGIGVKEKDGKVEISEVLYNTPAYKAGLKTGDVIIKIDGYEISRPQMLKDYLQNVTKNEKIALTVKKSDNSVIDVFLLPTSIKNFE